MQLLNLNIDVLLHITAFQTRDDISRLARTCRSLHDTLAPTILEGIIWLTQCRVASFLQFIHLDSTGSITGRDLFPFLRILCFNLIPDYRRPMSLDESVQAFTNILRHCRHLQSLALYCTSMAFTPEQLRVALSSPLPDLQDVTLDGVTDDHRDVLADLASPLHTVQLFMARHASHDNSNRFGHADPLPMLQYHRSALSTLTLSRVTLGDFGAPFPNVRMLVVSSFSIVNNETGWVGPLVHLFPNVEHLDLWSLYSRGGVEPTRNLDPRDRNALLIAGDWRMRAKVWQEQRGTWADGLRFLRVHSMMDLYCLGLSCRVERLDVYELSPSAAITAAALADARPRCLWFLVSSVGEMDKGVPTLLRAVARTPSVTHLMIDFGDDLVRYADPEDLLAQLADLLRDTAVSCLFMHVGDTGPGWVQLFGEVVATPPRVDTPQALHIFARGNRALRRVFVSYEPCGMRAWETRRGNGGQLCTRWNELAELRAREIVTADGLVRYTSVLFSALSTRSMVVH